MLFFQCDIVAERGGETPLSDMRKVTAAIPEGIKNKFLEKGVLYVRNYRPGLDVPWQAVFQTSDKRVVEAYCQENDMKFEWIGDDSLRASQINQAMGTHLITKENIWFNQAHLFHVSNLEPIFRDFLTARYSLKELPRNTYYGDGEAIDVEVLDIIRSAYEKYKTSFSWEKNDANTPISLYYSLAFWGTSAIAGLNNYCKYVFVGNYRPGIYVNMTTYII